jgi:hypothetical protein
MRWVGPDPDVREVEEGQLWIGVMSLPRPHVALVTRRGEDVRIQRFKPEDAREMGEQLIAFADQLNADNN